MKNNNEKKESRKEWLKRIGIGGIIFFTVKGIITTYLIIKAGQCAIQN